MTKARRTTADTPSAAAAPDFVQEQLSMIGPMVGQTTQATFRATLGVLAEPATAVHLAAFARHYYEALVAEGFTADEAVRIVAGHGVPGLPFGR